MKNYTSKFSASKNNFNEIKHLSQMLMYRFLSEIEKITDERKISRKDLAKEIDVSPSYLTQLYRGVKPLNMETLAKIELALDFRFEVKAVEKSLLEVIDNVEFSWDEEQINHFIKKFNCKDGLWTYKNHSKPNTPEDIKNMTEVDYSGLPNIDDSKNKLRRVA